MLRIIISCFIVLFAFSSVAQTTKISGSVKSGGQQLSSASVQLKTFPEEELLFYGFSDEDGKYELIGALSQSNKFIVIVSHIGYKRDTLVLNRSDLNKEFKHNFDLSEDKKQLDEIYIKAPPAVTVDNDTTKYNVKQFTSPDDRNLESVIKKMPGMEVNKDGTIFFKGKKISKVLLEGDDLTGEGYKAITKNLKPELVEEVQALDHYVEDDLLKGIINSDDIVLNLKIKDKKAKKILGSIDAGLGTIDRREISTNLISFINKTKAFAFGNHNNVSNQSNNNLLDLVDENRVFTGNNRIIRNEVNAINPFDDKLSAIGHTSQGSLNAISRLSDKFKISYALFYARNKLFGETAQQNLYFGPTIASTAANDSRSNLNKTFKADFNVDYLVKSNARLTSKFSYKQEPKYFNSTAFSTFNKIVGDSVLQYQYDTNKTFNGFLKYTVKQNKRSAYLFSAKILADDVNQNYYVNSNLYNTISIFNNSNRLLQEVKNINFKLKLDAEALKRYNSSFLYFNIGNELNRLNLNSNLLNENGNSVGSNYVNSSLFNLNQTYFTSKYVYDNQTIKVTAQLKSTLQLLNNLGKDSTYIILEPVLSFAYKFNQVHNLFFSYGYRNTNPQPIEYYENYILTGIRNFNSGLSNFYNYNTHSMVINYGFNDFGNSYFNLNASINGSYSKYGFLYTNFFNNSLNYSEKQPYNGISTFGGNLNAKKFVPLLSLNVTATYAPSITNYYAQLGSGVSKCTSLNQALSFKINTGFNLPINFGASTEFVLSNTKREGNLIATNNMYKYALEYRYKISQRIFNTSSYNLYKINNQSFNVVDTEVQYNPQKGNFIYSLQGKNLANIKAFTNANISETSSSSYASTVMGRYVMLNVAMSIK
ncbi:MULTISPECIES: hypothetical protein [unclassified Pedobacter]|uniref:hypothetical protein n=1 Tax=unclassified Pedobacter TaxID=2628915 RepID=UPI001E4DA03D|nr:MULTISPECIES: hypothetical protein [unclassified Pedobacter]